LTEKTISTPENDRESMVQKAIFTSITTDKMHRKAIEKWATDAGMHRSQHRMLMYLSRCENIPSQKDLALHFDISPAAVTTALKKLESDGYIERGKCSLSSDSRVNEISITERGREAVKESKKYFHSVDEKTLEGFSDEELDSFIGYLERIQDNLKNSEETEIGKDEK
jgi:DNA-binding MarR family transcriptional regulator